MEEEPKSAQPQVRFEKGRNDQVVLKNRTCMLLGSFVLFTESLTGLPGPKDLPGFNYSPDAQTWKLFIGQLPRVGLTILFLVAIIVTLLSYVSRGNVDNRARLVFNTISTGLGLGLALNFFEVFKDMAKNMRWRILSNRGFDAREVDLILGSESLMKNVQLIWESYRKPLTIIACLAWILLNIMAQAVVAMMPIFYALEQGTDANGTTVVPGTVSIPSLDCYYQPHTSDECPGDWSVPPSLAHDYGGVGVLSNDACVYRTDNDIPSVGQGCPYLRRADGREFLIRYPDYNPNDTLRIYPNLATGRNVRVSVGDCPHQHSPPSEPTDDQDGQNNSRDYTFYNGTANITVSSPNNQRAWNATTYIWNGMNLPLSADAESCGERCVHVYAHRVMAKDGRNDQQEDMFQCPITVTPMSNADLPVHELPDNMARMAAGAIGLTGRWRKGKPGFIADWRTAQLYQQG